MKLLVLSLMSLFLFGCSNFSSEKSRVPSSTEYGSEFVYVDCLNAAGKSSYTGYMKASLDDITRNNSAGFSIRGIKQTQHRQVNVNLSRIKSKGKLLSEVPDRCFSKPAIGIYKVSEATELSCVSGEVAGMSAGFKLEEMHNLARITNGFTECAALIKK